MRLCDRDIEAWLDEGRLSINPRPPVERINGATVDVRLGNKFRTFRGHTAAFIDLSGPKDEVSAALDRVMSDEIVLDEGEAFYLHPGELALAVTLESVTLRAPSLADKRRFGTADFTSQFDDFVCRNTGDL